ncbi:MAG: CpsD/CapB family tyrosine-protein kinase [Firmicutes bacterium]|nr:CpsD/CapB family tyrosine-protein kinase [Bacillota bacterium]
MLDFLKHKRKKKNSLTDKNESGPLFALNDSRSPVAEAFRTLRTNIGFASVDSLVRVILVTSPVPEDGKSTVVANLALVMAQAGNRVLLLDADLRKPTQQNIFQAINNKGLVNVLVQGEKLSEVIQPVAIGGVDLVTSGPIPPNPSELLTSDKFSEFLSDAREKYDIILIDSPPVILVTDPVLLASLVDGVILVINAGSTKIDLINSALDQLKKSSGRILGVVLNDVKSNAGYYNYNYYYLESGK